jgi:hypothetical protein
MSDANVWPRLVAAIGAVVLGAAAVAIVAVLAHRTPGPIAAAAPRAPSAPPEKVFPAPPENAVVFSRRDGTDVLALAVVPGRQLGLQASVVGGQGEGVDGLGVSFRLGSHVSTASTCGAGCYEATVPSRTAPQAVEVDVRRRDRTTSWLVRMPRPWPPRDASALVARTTSTFRKLHSFVVREWLTSGSVAVVFSRWTIVAPDKLSYQVKGGPQAVIIGNRRWDKLPGQRWEQSEQAPIHQPTPFWSSWTDAHVLESRKASWRVSFFDPKARGWYELLIAKRSLLPQQVRMHMTAHFMREVYGRYNAPLQVTRP